MARRERRRVVKLERVKVRASLPADLQQVAEAPGVMTATSPPLRWISALVATVVPWDSRSTERALMPNSLAQVDEAVSDGGAGLVGVEGVLNRRTGRSSRDRRRNR